MPVKRDTFFAAYQKALDEGDAAVFVGAGLSIPAGFPGWKELLREIADELDLDIDEETDLIAVAQYHVNQTRGRAGINRKLMEEFTKDVTPRAEHHYLATLPLSCVWTTNYDHLIEDAFKVAHKRVDRKVVTEDLARTLPKRDVVVYKMHGDIDRPDDAVLTKADYERYGESRQLFSVQLRGDLVSKTFLFLGLSFTDPNINYILGRIRSLVGENRRDHYWVTRDANAESPGNVREVKRQKHRIEDLKTYGIQTLLVDSYEEVPAILQELNRRVHRKNVFVSGSAHDYEPFGRDRALNLLRRLGVVLIDAGFNLVCGMGLGVGDAVAMGAIEAVYRKEAAHIDDRTILRPFPQMTPSKADRDAIWARYRQEMLARARSAIFVLGNKLNENGDVVPATGMRAEFEIALETGVYPIPLGATGHVAEELSRTVIDNVDSIYGDRAPVVKPHLERLADAASDDKVLIDSVLAVLRAIAPK